jgi:hypothetical protein
MVGQALSPANCFIKVQVPSGPLESRVGWVCEDQVFGTVAMP